MLNPNSRPSMTNVPSSKRGAPIGVIQLGKVHEVVRELQEPALQQAELLHRGDLLELISDGQVALG